MSDAIPLPSHPELDRYQKLAEDHLRARKAEAETATLDDARLFVARAHGFASWPIFAEHIDALNRPGSPDAMFEAAADAIVTGDIDTLRRLLEERPDLVRQRSSREHHSTLLHYVSANGIEDFRQKTPRNILEITRLLLDAGAEVNAESDAYGGRSMTLGLVATSVHPRDAGLQIPLLELLLQRGAVFEHQPGAAVWSSLANGCPEAAEFLASRGAELDLVGAAGLGRLQKVKQLFADATPEQRESAFLYACGYGWTEVVRFMLDAGVSPAVSPRNGFSGLHWAAEFGHLETVELLLEHGAPLEAKNIYGGTVLDQAVWSAIHEPRPHHPKIIELLVAAGAKVTGEDRFTGKQEIDDALRRGYAEAIAAGRREGKSRDLVVALKGLGQLERDAGNREAALALYEEAVAVGRRLGEPIPLAHTIRHVADIQYELGHLDLAESAYDEALAIYRGQKPPALDLANAVRGLAILKEKRGQLDDARRLWEEAHALYGEANVAAGVVESAARAAKLRG